MHSPGRTDGNLQILVVYGQHASLERTAPIVEVLRDYGEVWHPDMPGFGGMDSFYKLGLRATTDNYARYLHEFIEQHIGGKPLVLVGLSYGFANITRLLQLYPEHLKQTVAAISFVGFTGARDFAISPAAKRLFIQYYAAFGSTWVGNKLLNLQHAPIWRPFYWWIYRHKYAGQPNRRAMRQADSRIQRHLWKINDNRTHAATAYEFLFSLDLRGKPLPVSVYHLGTSYDDFFDHDQVVAHMREVYPNLTTFKLNLSNHSPSNEVTVDDVRRIIPMELLEAFKHLAQ